MAVPEKSVSEMRGEIGIPVPKNKTQDAVFTSTGIGMFFNGSDDCRLTTTGWHEVSFFSPCLHEHQREITLCVSHLPNRQYLLISFWLLISRFRPHHHLQQRLQWLLLLLLLRWNWDSWCS
jgi:hypothetical protein